METINKQVSSAVPQQTQTAARFSIAGHERKESMKKAILIVLRVIALAVIYALLSTLASSLTSPHDLTRLFTPEQMSQAMAAIPIVSLIMTAMLSYLALRSRWHGWKLAAALFLIPYTLYTFLGQIEILAFPAVSSQMPDGLVQGSLIGGLLLTIPFSLLAVWILRKTGAEPRTLPSEQLKMPVFTWVWKVAVGALMYVIVYFTFGYYVAWRTPGLPAFYAGTDPGSLLGQLTNILRDTPWLPLFQFLRGLVWVGIGSIIIRMHKGGSWEVVLTTGLTFTVLMNASLIFPNPFMPPFVAHAHAIELVSSNFVYGILLALLMLWAPTRLTRRIPAPDWAH